MTLTPPQRRALTILSEGPARYSNTTTPHPDPAVYWMVADRLLELGYATWTGPHHRTHLTITDRGQEALG